MSYVKYGNKGKTTPNIPDVLVVRFTLDNWNEETLNFDTIICDKTTSEIGTAINCGCFVLATAKHAENDPAYFENYTIDTSDTYYNDEDSFRIIFKNGWEQVACDNAQPWYFLALE